VRREEAYVLGLNRVRFRSVPALLAVVLGGCTAGSLTGVSFSRAPEPPPLVPVAYPEKYRVQIADFMRTYLHNPTKVKDAFIGEPVVKPVGGTPLYVTCVRYNPRDSKNQYEGGKTNLAVFLGGKLSQFLPGDPELCSGLTYARSPEIEAMVP
jgi:hypothetical protein